MRYPLFMFMAVIVLISTCGFAEEQPFDVMEKAWTPFMAKDDSLAFPLKIGSMLTNTGHFWGGGKDVFLEWCRTHTKEWLDNPGLYVIQQGDPHLGNIGTFLAEGEPEADSKRELGEIGFGLLDFDESCRLPFQIELLQGVVSLRLMTHQGKHKFALSPAQTRQLVKLMLEDYKLAAASTRSATRMLQNDHFFKKLERVTEREKYREDLKRYTDGEGHFVRRVDWKEGGVREILRPAGDRRAEIAAGIVHAMQQSKRFRKLFRMREPAEVRAAIKDVTQRTHLGPAGSQGLRKYLVLMDKPFEGVDHDIILYFKEEIPSAAERSGIASLDRRPAGQRCALDIETLTNPRPYAVGWCNMGRESYLITLKHPWIKSVEEEEVRNLDDLQHMARIWAIVAGASHRQRGELEIIAGNITPQLVDDLVRLSDEYLVQLFAQYESLRADPRARQLSAAARAAVNAAGLSDD